jgi:hypothetical protein
MKEIQAPNRAIPEKSSRWPSIFLAGSIEMGAAENWQSKILNDFKRYDILFFNPRRDDWDSSWKQELNNPQFYEQVTWELDHLNKADIIALYFDPNTKSPISLLELGLYANTRSVVVCCPDEFWRKGNVDIVCQRYGIPVFNNYDAWLVEIKNKLAKI